MLSSLAIFLCLVQIFSTDRVSLLVTGDPQLVAPKGKDTNVAYGPDRNTDRHSTFQSLVYQSFVRTFVATMYDICNDMNELIRMARLLWPIYIQPLSSTADLEQTFKQTATQQGKPPNDPCTSETKTMDAIVLEYLDRRALGKFRHAVDMCFSSIAAWNASKSSRKNHPGNNPMEFMSRHARYLLLAAYLCQVNRPDQDRALFSIERNGRPSRKRGTGSEETPTSDNTTSKNFRLRSFPMERMLSLYVSLVALHETLSLEEDNSRQYATTSLQERFGEWLHHLQSLGVIQETSSSQDKYGSIRLSAPRYTCNITSDQAHSVASSLDFPLDRYVF